MAQSTQVEIDHALSTAREAWAADHEKELEERVSQLEKDLREQLEAKYDEEKRQLVDDTLREAEAKFKNERRKLEEELRRNNVSLYLTNKSSAFMKYTYLSVLTGLLYHLTLFLPKLV